jgi:hypothetical protein
MRVNPNGHLKLVGWNATEALDLKSLPPCRFDRLRNPIVFKPPPAGGAYVGVEPREVSWIGGAFVYIGSHGVQIGQVVPGSPAAQAGLQPADVIETIG